MLTLQNALVKDLLDKKRSLIMEFSTLISCCTWEHFNSGETKIINLHLKTEFAETYTGKSSKVYFYYTARNKIPERRNQG